MVYFVTQFTDITNAFFYYFHYVVLRRQASIESPCQKEMRGTGPKIQKNLLVNRQELLTVPP